jgi:phosphatidylserine/phosphatidylglycerophosphate/cardiolipin synthase-like enzyme
MDVCEARWDDGSNLATNALRLTCGKPTKPYHDVQVYLTGREPAATLERLFIDHWTRSGKPLDLLPVPIATTPGMLEARLPLGSTRLALSRTDPRADGSAIREVELYVDIAAADASSAIETQYSAGGFRPR